MAKVIIALGSNIGDRLAHMSNAHRFLKKLSTRPLLSSSLFETEPVGDTSTSYYYNAVCEIETPLEALTLLEKLKTYEQQYGRDPDAPRWSNRTIDLDIIDYDRQVITTALLKTPHPEYQSRLFVLEPLKEIHPGWSDSKSGRAITELIAKAPKNDVFKTSLNW